MVIVEIQASNFTQHKFSFVAVIPINQLSNKLT
jgi:hypothetical protein